jgi:predicted nucleic acid-binding Zn ribbon protein
MHPVGFCIVCGYDISNGGRRNLFTCSTLCRDEAYRRRQRKKHKRKRKNRSAAYLARRAKRITERKRAKRQADPVWQARRVAINERKHQKELRRQRWPAIQEERRFKKAQNELRRKALGLGGEWNNNLEYQRALNRRRHELYKKTESYQKKLAKNNERRSKYRALFAALRNMKMIDNQYNLLSEPTSREPAEQQQINPTTPMTAAERAARYYERHRKSINQRRPGRKRNAEAERKRQEQRAIIIATLRSVGWLPKCGYELILPG